MRLPFREHTIGPSLSTESCHWPSCRRNFTSRGCAPCPLPLPLPLPLSLCHQALPHVNTPRPPSPTRPLLAVFRVAALELRGGCRGVCGGRREPLNQAAANWALHQVRGARRGRAGKQTATPAPHTHTHTLTHTFSLPWRRRRNPRKGKGKVDVV